MTHVAQEYAVITDTVSPDFWFRTWHAYYSNAVGAANLYVLTNGTHERDFADFPGVNVCKISDCFDDDQRLQEVNSLVSRLLEKYKAVIRVDVDEFLIPENLISFPSLADFLIASKDELVTAKGYDIFQAPGENTLSFAEPILSQRRFCYPLYAMCKTVLTRVPIIWGRGFHYCNYRPCFGGLRLIHMKRACIDTQLAISSFIQQIVSPDSFEYNYHSSMNRASVLGYHSHLYNRPVLEGFDTFDELTFFEGFLRDSSKRNSNGLYEAGYQVMDKVIKMPFIEADQAALL